jgi:hypothetical protein
MPNLVISMSGKKKVPERRSGLCPEKELPERRSGAFVTKIPLVKNCSQVDIILHQRTALPTFLCLILSTFRF